MKRSLFFSVFIFHFCLLAQAQQDPATRSKQFNLEKGLALQGYDPVAYFTEHRAIKGSRDNALSYAGVVYYFSSPANKELFRGNPSKYEPEYGGWCAYAMGAKGEKVEIDPKTFKIVNGKLYLFYNRFFNNTLTDWNKDENNLKSHADANWQKIVKQ